MRIALGGSKRERGATAIPPIHGNVTVTLTDELGGKHVVTAKDILIRPGYIEEY